MTTTNHPPVNSRLLLMAATLSTPLNALIGVVIPVFLIVLGLTKFLPTSMDPPLAGTGSAGEQLLSLATGGVIATDWGCYLIGAVQTLLGIGLLIPVARPVASLGCLLMTVLLIIGGIMHRSALISGHGLNPTGVALLVLTIVLLSGAALGARHAAQRCGAAT